MNQYALGHYYAGYNPSFHLSRTNKVYRPGNGKIPDFTGASLVRIAFNAHSSTSCKDSFGDKGSCSYIGCDSIVTRGDYHHDFYWALNYLASTSELGISNFNAVPVLP